MVGKFVRGKNIRIYYECEAGIEKIGPDNHPLSSQGLSNVDKQ